jgi:hypothetical protein
VRNYPYREAFMNTLIKKMNHIGDSYPVYLGKIETGEIDDVMEERLDRIWDEHLN